MRGILAKKSFLLLAAIFLAAASCAGSAFGAPREIGGLLAKGKLLEQKIAVIVGKVVILRSAIADLRKNKSLLESQLAEIEKAKKEWLNRKEEWRQRVARHNAFCEGIFLRQEYERRISPCEESKRALEEYDEMLSVFWKKLIGAEILARQKITSLNAQCEAHERECSRLENECDKLGQEILRWVGLVKQGALRSLYPNFSAKQP